MADRPRIALWFAEGLADALAARCALGELQAQYPHADWVLLGPKSSLCLFEMDNRVAAYIPLLNLGPRRPSQSWLSRFFETRAQYRQLRRVGFSQCIGVAVVDRADVEPPTAVQPSAGQSNSVQPNAAQPAGGLMRQTSEKRFNQFKSALKVPGVFIEKKLSEFLANERPLLQAGPQALAFATQLHRSSPPHLPKLLVLLADVNGRGEGLEQQLNDAQDMLQQQGPAHITVAVVDSRNSRLLARWIGKNHPDWLAVDLAQAMGLLAYADRVMTFSEEITRICAEMGRSDRMLLGKTHS